MANPYHDKEGKFTSKGNQGSAEPKQETEKTVNKIQLKPGVDLSNFPKPEDVKAKTVQSVETQYSGKIDTTVQLTMPTSIENAMEQGNKILGFNSVFYTEDTDLALAHEMNRTLQMVVNDFPKCFEDQQLLGYGNTYKKTLPTDSDITVEKTKKREREVAIVKKILAKPEWQQILANIGYSEAEILDDITKDMHHTEKKNLNFDPLGTNVGGQAFNIGTLLLNNNLIFQKHARGITDEFNPLSIVRVNKNFHTIEEWNKVVRFSIATGFHLPYGDSNYIVSNNAHELGHHCLFSLSRLMNQQEFEEFWKLTDPKSLAKEWLNGEVSEYARKNRHETVAEAFADHYARGDNATKYNKKLFNFIKGVYDRVFGVKKV